VLKDSEEHKTGNKNKTKKIEGKNKIKNRQQKFTNKSHNSQAKQRVHHHRVIESSSQEPQTFPASAMAPVCFRTCRVR
jgi:hypothetical protein